MIRPIVPRPKTETYGDDPEIELTDSDIIEVIEVPAGVEEGEETPWFQLLLEHRDKQPTK